MIGTRELVDDIIIIPFPRWESDSQDAANDIALKLRDAFNRAHLTPENGEAIFAPSSLHNLDELPHADLFLAIAAVAATVEERVERAQKSVRKATLQQMGHAALELAELYRPIPPSPRQRRTNPYGIERGHDPSLSYQPGAMRHRSRKGR